MELNPVGALKAHAGLGLSYLLENKFEEAANAAQTDAADWARLLIVSCARWGQKRVHESDAALAELIAKLGEIAAYQIAEVYAYRNDKDQAFEWLERARRQRDPGLASLRKDTAHGESPRRSALECILAHDGPGRRPIEVSVPNGKAKA